MTSPNEPNVEMSDRSQGSSKAVGSVLRVSLILIALIGAACGDDFGGGRRVEALCSDTCGWAYDGACDDGGADSAYSGCQYGSDCNDCGPRDPTEYNCCDDYRFVEDQMACITGLKDCP